MKVYGMECVVNEKGYIERVYCHGGCYNIYKACVKRYWNNGRLERKIDGYDREYPTAQQLRRWIKNDMVKFC